MRRIVLSIFIIFLAMVFFTPIVKAHGNPTPVSASSTESESSMAGSVLPSEPGRVFASERDALAIGSLLSAGYVVVNSYSVCPNTGESGFSTFNMFDVPVRNQEGVLLGGFTGLLLNNSNYNDAIAVINIGSAGGDQEGDRFIAVPMTALKIRETESGKLDVVLNKTRSELQAAPLFDASRIDNSQYETYLYMYYGVQPYWTEECVGQIK